MNFIEEHKDFYFMSIRDKAEDIEYMPKNVICISLLNGRKYKHGDIRESLEIKIGFEI